jgi:hypothetical protein
MGEGYFVQITSKLFSKVALPVDIMSSVVEKYT